MLRLLISGGGSGGHIIPNLAVIEELQDYTRKKKIGFMFQYICSRASLDTKILRDHKIPFHPIYSWKLRRYFDIRNFFEPLCLIMGFFQSVRIIFSFKPDVIFLKGGYVCIPVALAGWICRKKIIVHESDVIPGLANRIIAWFAIKRCSGFPQKKYVFTGNPVRKKVVLGKKGKAYAFTGFNEEKKVVLVIGGSQGALVINNAIQEILPDLCQKYQIVHITGIGKKINYEHDSYRQYEYLDDELFDIYQITDLAITRAGASSLAELAANKIPMIIIPHHAGNNHQDKNADYYVREGVAVKNKQTEKLSSDIKAAILECFHRKWKFEQNLGENFRAAEDIRNVILNFRF